MSTKTYIHRYNMQSRQGLNSRSHTTTHEGALIRVEEEGASGFGCLHPWVELGDPSLDELVQQLSYGAVSRQVRCALHCADLDRAARKEKVNLFDGLQVPDSHATIVGGVDRVALAVKEGFDTIKMKLGRDVLGAIKLVKEVHEEFPALRLRFDFNGVLGEGQVIQFITELGDDIVNQIDFLEDPSAPGEDVWEELRDVYGVKTAVDRGVANTSDGELEFDYAVIKPAVNQVDKLCSITQMNGRQAVVTSYMDHPVGQCYAAYMAGVLDRDYLGVVDKRCGLMTHSLFEPTAFTEQLQDYLGASSPQWSMTSKGTGLGFDDLLEALPWKAV